MSERPNLRLRIVVRGAVQGVGFRPFVYRLAGSLALAGWVRNSTLGVVIEVEGPQPALEEFRLRLEREKPPRAFIQSVEATYLDPAGLARFSILASDVAGETEALILPDIATCLDCQREINDPTNRRYRYPFTNCTNCGPRFTIIEALPYDRPNTTMRAFSMCPACRAEYENPGDRRFHAQPNACPDCGPQLALWDRAGRTLATKDAALRHTVQAVRAGQIVAVKGLGGFHLIADASNADAVQELRRRKAREEKPFACMFPSLAAIRAVCDVSPQEERLLASPEAPIVLLRRRATSTPTSLPCDVAAAVAPGNPYLGVMLPYTPLHHLLLADLGIPVVATSGNLAEEPICIDEHDARTRLGGIADLFLVHDRPIVRHADDSIARLCAGRELLLRRARGYAPLPVPLAAATPPVLAVGAHLKNCVALASGRNAFVAQHIGDLETARAQEAFQSVIHDLGHLLDISPRAVACDLHPDYIATRYARALGLPVTGVQHHAAHAFACMGENEVATPALAVTWDGTGYGLDGTVWGGEFLRLTDEGYERVAHLRTFRLPGGDQAVREPRRSAFGVLCEIFGEQIGASLEALNTFSPAELRTLGGMIRTGTNSPRTSSAGRLFDAVASLIGLRQITRFEGQAAMELEFAASRAGGPHEAGANQVTTYDAARSGVYPFRIDTADDEIIDWEPLIRSVLLDRRDGVSAPLIARKFHNTLVEIIVAVAQRFAVPRVVLTGGCFQNVLLTECAIARLRQEGFAPYWHQRVPPNDGGIALGQIVAAIRARSASGHVAAGVTQDFKSPQRQHKIADSNRRGM